LRVTRTLLTSSPGNLSTLLVSNARRTRAPSHPCERGADLPEN
jgi:hypothetical protein